MNRIRVARFRDRAEAEPIRQRLMEAGIGAEVHDELGLARLWFTNKRTAGARLEVPAGHAERAEDLLRGWDAASGALSRAIRCPECKSLRIDYPQFTPKSF